MTYFRVLSVTIQIPLVFCLVEDTNFLCIDEIKKETLKKDITPAMLLSIICYLPTTEILEGNYMTEFIQWHCDILV